MRYGTTAHSDQPLNMATTGTESIGGLGTSQIDSRPGAEDSSGIARQVLNPGGDKYDEQRYGETGSAVPGTTVSNLRQQTERSTSSMTLKSGMHGPYARQADTGMAGSEFGSTTGQALPDRSALGTSASGERSFPLSGGATNPADGAGQSHFGRDAGLAGAGMAGTGALAYEAERSRQPQDSLSGAGLTGGMDRTELGTSGLQPTASNPRDVPGDPFGYHKPDEVPVEGYVHHTHGPHSTDIANVLDPHVPGEFPTEGAEGLQSSTLGRDAAIGGAGLGAAGLGAAGYEASQPRNEPYVGSATGSEYPIPTTTNMRSQEMAGQSELPTQPEHHYGRDAAMTGGAGAAGLAGYEALKDRDTAPTTSTTGEHPQSDGAILRGGHEDSQVTPAAYYEALRHENTGHMTGTTGQSSAATGPRDANIANVTDQRTQYEPETVNTSVIPLMQDEPHYGRDAAIVGGTGLAAGGVYEATRPTEEVRPTRVELVQAIKSHEGDGHLHKTTHQQEKHEAELERAREQEAAHGGDHGQKKEGFLSRMLHGHKHEDAEASRPDDGIRTHTITGLPMNVGKYGDGHGGTDAAPQIPGAHPTNPNAAADWEDIKSKNTAY